MTAQRFGPAYTPQMTLSKGRQEQAPTICAIDVEEHAVVEVKLPPLERSSLAAAAIDHALLRCVLQQAVSRALHRACQQHTACVCRWRSSIRVCTSCRPATTADCSQKRRQHSVPQQSPAGPWQRTCSASPAEEFEGEPTSSSQVASKRSSAACRQQ